MARHIHLGLPVVAVALLLLLGLALNSQAQPPGVPNPYAIVSPTGSEIIKAENTGTYVSTVQLTQMRDAGGYVLLTGSTAPTTGTTFQAPNNTGVIYANPAGTLAAWTVTTPIVPVDGSRLQIFTTQIVTAFNLTASTGQTVTGNIAGALAANSNVEYIYSLATKTWYRIA